MAFELCLFDLDDTLVRSSDLADFRGQLHVGAQNAKYASDLAIAFNHTGLRQVYPQAFLEKLMAERPAMKLGIFTRAPREYAQLVLRLAYPGIKWSVVIAYEDVQRTKPFGDGILSAMNACGVTDVCNVALVGDAKSDIMSAYHAGCWAIIDTSTWPKRNLPDNYRCLERIPDAIVKGPEQLRNAITQPVRSLPLMERLSWFKTANLVKAPPRFDTVNHFNELTHGQKPVAVHVMGKLFANYQGLMPRINWHKLTTEIIANKDSDIFPETWILAIRAFLQKLHGVQHSEELTVTVIPFKPGRKPRLERLLTQLELSLQTDPIADVRVRCVPDILAFRAGVQSHHGQHLNKRQRFENVRDHLYVKRPDCVQNEHLVVIDDVVTTGASLVFASIFLQAAGASKVTCLALAKTISDG